MWWKQMLMPTAWCMAFLQAYMVSFAGIIVYGFCSRRISLKRCRLENFSDETSAASPTKPVLFSVGDGETPKRDDLSMQMLIESRKQQQLRPIGTERKQVNVMGSVQNIGEPWSFSPGEILFLLFHSNKTYFLSFINSPLEVEIYSVHSVSRPMRILIELWLGSHVYRLMLSQGWCTRVNP